MTIRDLDIPGLKLIIPKWFGDSRGRFQEAWSERAFRDKVEDTTFVQDNQSMSARRGTLRGLHFQKPPFAQGKLVRVLRGSILDVAVDVRHGSPTYGRHLSLRLDAEKGEQIWVPTGFLHGFCTLEDDTEVFYKVTAYYSGAHDAGILWNDPDLAIDWPVDADSVVLSDKDQQLPLLRELPRIFDFADDPGK
jgi:dTDP-4-dehydrorhamnose 3,5-epimerase